jgi:hypothetical protein
MVRRSDRVLCFFVIMRGNTASADRSSNGSIVITAQVRSAEHDRRPHASAHRAEEANRVD